MKKKVLVAMSGGVDSSVAAAILKEEGHEVLGATFRTWARNDCQNHDSRSCCSLAGVEDAREVAHRLGIPHQIFNFEELFRKYVVDYFADEYLKGRTPNPCIACNEFIKFRLFFERARELGFDAIATGHYAQIGFDELRGAYYLAEGADPTKDQSYVLFPVGQELLPHILFPLGGLHKTRVREKAEKLGLPVKDKPDSQEICFIPDNDYGSFIEKEYLGGKTGSIETKKQTGVIRTRDGKILGLHEGYFHYTRGQRRGLRVPYAERLYVVDTDPQKNEVVVGPREDVLNHGCVVERVRWFLKPGKSRFQAYVKIRAQHRKALANISLLEDDKARIVFEESQEAITPGQGAVMYENARVLGGGWIESLLPARA
ncbi:MAG: tRNA 2-thiouridine(34) synthase MnmA [Candidatus Omnitrophica bacterium]|nr:tRNA 2-thiouridine(34) synthase MnmA [Candidatus Omnitrophota bacterium]MDD5670310.1 tRNA 2-thiouridine(34) synthase MnmA [Candidatus Omnitrophota bacterium]